ncbi:MAG: FAD-dependent oxidoreductase, partial [Burkholderiales bacterium]|nr:FAD-dependent oxidoreductase [Burkholderiales bacterium]
MRRQESKPVPGITPALGRRHVLGLAVAAPVAASALLAAPVAAARTRTQAHVVIAGSGLGGLAVAHRLQALLDGVRITIVDAKEEHNYQPGYTLVATGVWPVEKVRERNVALQPAGVEWVKEMVTGFEPEANTVVTASGRRIGYDFLVVAT